MSEMQPDFQLLMEQVRAGSGEAVRELLDTYGAHILRVVRRRLNKRLRPKFDSGDFVQAVWASFFASGLEKGSFDRPEQLAAFLAAVAGNKVADANRQRLRYRKFNIEGEKSLEGSAAVEAEGLTDHGPTPSQVFMAKEKMGELRQQATRPGRRILKLLQRGVPLKEIAAKLGVSKKTIQRLIRNLRPDPGV
jgi:RNA polymerase sigma factor (sigma-70 family)